MKRKVETKQVLFSLALLLIVIFSGDGLIKHRPYFPALYWRSMDPLVHGLIGMIVLSPLARSAKDLILFFLASSLIDIDHIVMARSFHIPDMLALPVRPITHSITFALFVAGTGYLLTRKRLVFWVLLIALVSHVVRDGASGYTPILYPLDIQVVPYSLYVFVEVGLYFTSLLLLWLGIMDMPDQPAKQTTVI